MYQAITAEKPLIPKKTSNRAAIIRNIKLILLSFHDRFLNLSENIGISAIINQENSRIIMIRKNTCVGLEVI